MLHYLSILCILYVAVYCRLGRSVQIFFLTFFHFDALLTFSDSGLGSLGGSRVALCMRPLPASNGRFYGVQELQNGSWRARSDEGLPSGLVRILWTLGDFCYSCLIDRTYNKHCCTILDHVELHSAPKALAIGPAFILTIMKGRKAPQKLASKATEVVKCDC